VHSTPPDKLIGTLRKVESRLARYVAVSRLTSDLLDTTGILHSFEGELEEGDPLGALSPGGLFGESPAGGILPLGSTFLPPKQAGFATAVDSGSRMHQYEEHFNDRARYSLACVLDGSCPVNFRDQITVGNV
jgi:hypothetical protein